MQLLAQCSRYRVGIDYPRHCAGLRAPAPAAYAVTVNADGETYHASGMVELEKFELIVLEFDIDRMTDKTTDKIQSNEGGS